MVPLHLHACSAHLPTFFCPLLHLNSDIDIDKVFIRSLIVCWTYKKISTAEAVNVVQLTVLDSLALRAQTIILLKLWGPNLVILG